MEPAVQATSTIITQYGLAGFVVVSCLGALIYVVKDLLKKSDHKDEKEMAVLSRKDDQIIAMSKDFSSALKENAAAIQKLSQAEIDRATSAKNFQDWLKEQSEKNDKAHRELLVNQGEILQFVKEKAKSER